MGRWTNTTTYPNLAAPDAADILPIADVSAAAGTQQRTIQWSQVAAVGLAVVSASAPAVTNDVSEGYLVGRFWWHTTGTQLYLLTDQTQDAAVWTSIINVP